MGYGDCGVHGCRDIPTPNLDALANSGVRFSDGYVTGPVCSPSRASLLTGRYQYRDGVPDWIEGDKPGLNPGVLTIADYLKKAGYRTALIGKWHLGEREESHPLNRGFDEFFGFLGGGRPYYQAPNELKSANPRRSWQLVRGREPIAEPDYMTDAFCREAIGFIDRQQKSGQPFFLYLAFNAVHTPLQAPKTAPQKFETIADSKRRIYAGMVASLDAAVGRVLAKMRMAGMESNTLVCFVSDNGGPITRNSPNASDNAPLRGGKGETWEGGIRVPFFMSWQGRLPAGAVYCQPVIQMDLTATALALAVQPSDPKWPMDGVDLMPYLLGDNKGAPHEALFWKYESRQWAVRQGDWKLVSAFPAGARQPVTALFNLRQDIGETSDLSAAEPERVQKMQALWQQWNAHIQPQHAQINKSHPEVCGMNVADPSVVGE